MSAASNLVVTMTRDELRELIREELTELQPHEVPSALITIDALCAALSCSRTTINRFRGEGMPSMRFGDSPRFELSAVLEWLRQREQRAAASEAAE